jgi:hypothetical protein
MQIIILGMHRSGTSAVARIINLMGAYFGPEGSSLGFGIDNVKGWWERKDAMQLNDELLKNQDCSWNELSRWQFERAGNVPDGLRHSMRSLVLDLDAHRPWFLKDPRLCLTLPAWLPLLEAPVVVLVHRDPFEVAKSIQTRDSLPIAYALALWEYHAVGMLNSSVGLPRLYASYAELLSHPVTTCAALFDGLRKAGVRRLELPSDREVLAFIDPKLYRARSATADTLALSPAQRALAELLQGTRVQESEVRVSDLGRALISKGVSAILATIT